MVCPWKPCALFGEKIHQLPAPSVIFYDGTQTNISKYVQHVVVTSKVRKIPDRLFCSCQYLQTLDLGPATRLETIGSHAFSGCLALGTLSLRPNLKVIGPHAFLGCAQLRRVKWNSQLEEIQEMAFHGCYRLAPHDFTAATRLAYIGEKAF